MIVDPDCSCLTLKSEAGCFDVLVLRISRISLPCCHHFNLNFYFLCVFLNQLKLVVKKGNQTENLYIGESEFLFEPFHFFHVLLGQWAYEAPQIISSRKKVIPELWSSHSTASPHK